MDLGALWVFPAMSTLLRELYLAYTHVQLNKKMPNCFPNVVAQSVLLAALFGILLVSCSQPWGCQTVLALGSGMAFRRDVPFISFVTVSLNSSPWIHSHAAHPGK